MPDTYAFALDESITDFAGGTTTYGEGTTLDYGQLLNSGGGTIVTDDPEVAAALERVPGLVATQPPSGAKTTTKAKG